MQPSNFRIKEFLGYLLVVSIGLAIDYGVLYALITYTSIWYFYATAISFVLALASNFYLAAKFIFGVTPDLASKKFLLFATIGTTTLALNQAAIFTLVEVFGVGVLLSKGLTLPLTFSWNYAANKIFVFNLEKHET